MVSCPFCESRSKRMTGELVRFGVTVESAFQRCSGCGLTFLTFEQEEEAERLALCELESRESQAVAAPARRREAILGSEP